MTLTSLIRKEFQQIWHNAFTLRTMVFYALVVTLVQPLLLTLDIRSLTVAVVDKDESELSRRIVASIGHTEQLNVAYSGADLHKANVMLDEGRTHCVIEIPDGFERTIVGHSTGLSEAKPINVSTDAVNSMRGIQGTAFVTGCISHTIRAYFREIGIDIGSEAGAVRSTSSGSEENIIEHLLYNPTQDYRNFVLPTVFFLFITYLCGTFLATAVSDEKLRGTIEQINVCPIRRRTYVGAKIITFSIISMLTFAVDVVLIGWFYGVYPSGSILALSLAILLFTVCECALAIGIGNSSSDTIQAVMTIFFINYIMQVTSGFITPIECMPDWLQPATYAIPLRYTVEVLRNAYLKGTSVADLWQPLSYLAGLTVLCLIYAIQSYKRIES